jgi:hypothetical protein
VLRTNRSLAFSLILFFRRLYVSLFRGGLFMTASNFRRPLYFVLQLFRLHWF